MANIFPVSRILLLFHSPKGSWNNSAKQEKPEKYWSYYTRNRSITNAYFNYLVSSFYIGMFINNVKLMSLFLVNLRQIWSKNDFRICFIEKVFWLCTDYVYTVLLTEVFRRRLILLKRNARGVPEKENFCHTSIKI